MTLWLVTLMTLWLIDVTNITQVLPQLIATLNFLYLFYNPKFLIQFLSLQNQTHTKQLLKKRKVMIRSKYVMVQQIKKLTNLNIVNICNTFSTSNPYAFTN